MTNKPPNGGAKSKAEAQQGSWRGRATPLTDVATKKSPTVHLLSGCKDLQIKP